MVGERDLFYLEIRKNMQQFREEIADHEHWRGMLRDGALAILWLAGLAHKEGLLALDAAKDSERVSGLLLGAELWKMINLVCDGTDMDVVWDICLKRYFSRGYSGVEGILYLAYLDGMLNVQSGMYPPNIENSVKAMMPPEVEEELEKLLKQEAEESEQEQEAYMHLKDFFQRMSPRDIQKVLQEVSWGMLAVAMQGWDMELQKLICENLPKMVRETILEKMHEKACSSEEIIHAQRGVTAVMQRLEECGEIHIQG